MSVEGRALKCLGQRRLAVTLGTCVIDWDFIVAEIGEDQGIPGNNFSMAQALTVRPHEGAVYLPTFSSGRKEDMGERLPCAVWSVVEVKAITEEVLVVWALGTMTLAPCRSGERYHPHPEARGDGDGGSWARSTGIVPGTRGDRDGTGQ